MKGHPIALLGAVIVAVAACSEPQSTSAAFDSTAWIAGENAPMSTEAPRLQMADQLVKSRILLGKPRVDVESMLGRPTDTGKFREYDLVYWLGAERSLMSIDSEWLVIRFDESGKVSDVRMVTD